MSEYKIYFELRNKTESPLRCLGKPLELFLGEEPFFLTNGVSFKEEFFVFEFMITLLNKMSRYEYSEEDTNYDMADELIGFLTLTPTSTCYHKLQSATAPLFGWLEGSLDKVKSGNKYHIEHKKHLKNRLKRTIKGMAYNLVKKPSGRTFKGWLSSASMDLKWYRYKIQLDEEFKFRRMQDAMMLLPLLFKLNLNKQQAARFCKIFLEHQEYLPFSSLRQTLREDERASKLTSSRQEYGLLALVYCRNLLMVLNTWYEHKKTKTLHKGSISKTIAFTIEFCKKHLFPNGEYKLDERFLILLEALSLSRGVKHHRCKTVPAQLTQIILKLTSQKTPVEVAEWLKTNNASKELINEYKHILLALKSKDSLKTEKHHNYTATLLNKTFNSSDADTIIPVWLKNYKTHIFQTALDQASGKNRNNNLNNNNLQRAPQKTTLILLRNLMRILESWYNPDNSSRRKSKTLRKKPFEAVLKSCLLELKSDKIENIEDLSLYLDILVAFETYKHQTRYQFVADGALLKVKTYIGENTDHQALISELLNNNPTDEAMLQFYHALIDTAVTPQNASKFLTTLLKDKTCAPIFYWSLLDFATQKTSDKLRPSIKKFITDKKESITVDISSLTPIQRTNLTQNLKKLKLPVDALLKKNKQQINIHNIFNQNKNSPTKKESYEEFELKVFKDNSNS